MKTLNGLALAAALLGGAAFAQAPAPVPAAENGLQGLELSLHTGFALALGNAEGDTGGNQAAQAMSDLTSGQIPFQLGVGYRINQQFFAGAFFSFGVVPVKSSACAFEGCSANDMSFGIEGQYHLPVQLPIDPYLGLGVGYEMLHFTESLGDQSATLTYKGLQFASLSAGFDYRLSPSFAVGPLLDFSLGQYSTGSIDGGGQSASEDLPNKSLHEWFTIGVRGVFDVVR